ncbi:hypothetical protein GE09DRAFT_454931 [Coniochaeta sp. 2T2.1]|nr:hypothetical protein GE09DRAFT_454931 [Coniochaeta sp. 2T2.1]
MEDQAEQAALQPLISATHNPPSHAANVSQYPPPQPQYQPPPNASQYSGSQSPPMELQYAPTGASPRGPQYQQQQQQQQSTTPSQYQPTRYEASRTLPMDPNLQSYNGTPTADTPSNALSTLEPEAEGVEAMTTQEALRMYAPQQKIRDKIIADFKKGLSPEDLATKHGVALSTIHVVIKRFQQAESMTLSKSTRWRRKKKADAEEAARKAEQGGEDGGPGVQMCGEADFVKMKNQGACVTCTVKFQNVALGKTDTSGKNVKRSRTQFGCRNCRVHLCRKGYCWDVFHKHAQGV